MKVQNKRINTAEDLRQYAHPWKELQIGVDMTAYQSFQWNELLAEEFFKNLYDRFFCELWIYTVRDDERVVLIAPLVVQRHTLKLAWAGRKKGIYILGQGSYSDYLNFIYDSFQPEVIDCLIEHLKTDKKGYTINFNNIRENIAIKSYLDKNAEMIGNNKAVFIDILSNANEYMSKLSKNTKQNLRTALNRINKAGIHYTFECREKITDNAVLDRLFLLHTERLKTKSADNDKGGIHKLSKKLLIGSKLRKEKRYNIVRQSMQRHESSLAVIVKFDDVIVGYLYGLIDHKTFRVMHNSFSEEFKFYSPMFRGSYDFIMQEIDTPMYDLKQIDFTRGTEEYKLKLGGAELSCFHYVIR